MTPEALCAASRPAWWYDELRKIADEPESHHERCRPVTLFELQARLDSFDRQTGGVAVGVKQVHAP